MQTRITVMAKAPVAGKVKTRLIPAIGSEGAAALAEKMLMHTLATACDAAWQLAASVQICAAPVPQDDSWQPVKKYIAASGLKVEWSRQSEGDLGQRMAAAVAANAAEGYQSILVGMDCPFITVPHYVAAKNALATHDVSLVPSTDGGYVMLAVHAAELAVNATLSAALFEQVPWSTEQVFDITCSQLKKNGFLWHQQEPLRDIDNPSDLSLLSAFM